LVFEGARRVLSIGIGGGGDVVGALATAELSRLYHGSDPIVGGVSWERTPIDPQPGPRPAAEIENASEMAPGVLAAGPETCVEGGEIVFAESRMAALLGVQTVLVTLEGGPERWSAPTRSSSSMSVGMRSPTGTRKASAARSATRCCWRRPITWPKPVTPCWAASSAPAATAS
jgi:hypothetical protein